MILKLSSINNLLSLANKNCPLTITTNSIKKMRYLILYIATIFFLGGHFNYVTAQGTGENFPFSSYIEFDIEGGYEPGSFIVIKKKSAQTPIITSERLAKVVSDNTILTYTAPESIPNTVLDRKKNLILGLEAKSKYDQLPVEAKAALQKVRQVQMKVNNGSRYYLKNGTIALIDIIYALPKEDLEKLIFELQSKSKVYFVAEVIKYDSAVLDFSWVTEFDGNAKANIQNSLDIGVSGQWVDDATFRVKYKSGHLVGFKAIKVKKKYIKLIKERIKYRSVQGSDHTYYQDIDNDKFGNPERSIITPKAPNGYVDNNCDFNDNDPNSNRFFQDTDKDGEGDPKISKLACSKPLGFVKNLTDPDDNDRYNVMGAKLWFRDFDSDGFGDPNETKYGISQPTGYVENSKDCFDRNGDARPGQLSWFKTHRGDGSWDYDCNNTGEKRTIQIGHCNAGCHEAVPQGWWGSNIPECGQEASWLKDCDFRVSVRNPGCEKETVSKIQECR